MITIDEGKELYQSSGSRDKEILIVPGAGHNDIMLVQPSLYFDTIEKFIKTYG
ncbi:MAG: hypothetical protein HYY80_02395 [Chloroflexi bacterium]|nr:hypothetical protein [Chloroflexota bacterium]